MDYIMQKDKKPYYRYCIVPFCRNTNRTAPNKLFFMIPKGVDIRKKWCNIMRKDNMISPSSSLYCCEDHFDIEEDTDNYIKYKIMCLQKKHKIILRLKKGVVPHKFHCQKNAILELERRASKESNHLEKNTEALSASTTCITPKPTEISKVDFIEANTSSSQIYRGDIDMKNFCRTNCSASLSTKHKMFVYTCLECDYQMCHLCNVDSVHANHYILRGPFGRNNEEVESVKKKITQFLKPSDLEIGSHLNDKILPMDLPLEETIKTEEDLDIEDMLIKSEIKIEEQDPLEQLDMAQTSSYVYEEPFSDQNVTILTDHQRNN